MVELFEKNIKTNEIKSSKGNQLKWYSGGLWYKADYTGYEGLSEYVISKLISYSNIRTEEIISYSTEQIKYKHNFYLGCKSKNFLPDGWQLITLERLFKSHFNESLNSCVYNINRVENRITFLVEQIERVTGLKGFGNYICTLLTIDALFLNEDRHTHNIAVLLDEVGEYHYCPIFDNGAGLLADTIMDFPLSENTNDLISEVESKTFCTDFDEQLDAAESLYGQKIKFSFTPHDVDEILKNEKFYSDEIKLRINEIVLGQRRKYKYLFCDK